MKSEELRAARDSVVVEVRDTVREVTTVTVVLRQAQEPSQPDDTIRVTTVTDRTRAREKLDVRSKTVDVRVRVDTVYIVKDSTSVSSFTFQDSGSLNSKPSALKYLKWIFVILVALIVLLLVLRFGRKRSL